MPTQAEVDRGRKMVIGGFLDGRRIMNGRLYQREQSDYPAYIQKLKEEFPAYIAEIEASIPEQTPDTSPSIKTNDLIEPAYKILYTTIKEYNWEEQMENVRAVYKIVGEQTMGNTAFLDYLRLIFRYKITKYLPSPEIATLADGAYLANQVKSDKFEWLYQERIGENKLYNYAKALLAELSDKKFVPDDLQRQSSLFYHYGIGYDLLFIHVNPFELFEMLWEEQAQ
jgi:hypothetical protein